MYSNYLKVGAIRFIFLCVVSITIGLMIYQFEKSLIQGIFSAIFIFFSFRFFKILPSRRRKKLSFESLKEFGAILNLKPYRNSEGRLWEKGVLDLKKERQLVWVAVDAEGVSIFFCSFPRDGVILIPWENILKITSSVGENFNVVTIRLVNGDLHFDIPWSVDFIGYIPSKVEYQE